MHMPRLLKSAVVLGAVPLLVGSLIYGTWRFTRWHWLEAAGLFTIPIGFVAFVVGTFALVRHLLREFRVERTTRSQLWLQGVLVGGLLLVNFPAAAFFTLSAIDVSTRYTVRVHNDSDRPIESLVVTGPGVRLELGPIAPGQRTRRHIHFCGDGRLDFSARQQELQFGGQLDGYVTGGLGGDKSIRVRQRGVYEIQPTGA
jgi:hypothetical protein